MATDENADRALMVHDQILRNGEDHHLDNGIQVMTAEHHDELQSHKAFQKELQEIDKLLLPVQHDLRYMGKMNHDTGKNDQREHHLKPHRKPEKHRLYLVQQMIHIHFSPLRPEAYCKTRT